jgi:hypothetical protein
MATFWAIFFSNPYLVTLHANYGRDAFYLSAVQALVEDDAQRPDVDLGRNFRRRLAHHEALGRQVPVGPGALRGEVHAVVGVVDFGVHDLGEAEVGDLDVPDAAARQQNVAWSYEK